MFSQKIKIYIILVLVSLMASACGGGLSNDQQVATIVALTQTAMTLQVSAAAPQATEPESVQAQPTATEPPTIPVVPSYTPESQQATSGYQPLSADECIGIQVALSQALGLTGTVLNPAPFDDFVNQKKGFGCQVTFSTTAAKPMSGSGTDTLKNLGWTQNLNYAASGPAAMALGFQDGNALCIYASETRPSDLSVCPANQPIGMCMDALPPDQITQTVTVNCAQLVP